MGRRKISRNAGVRLVKAEDVLEAAERKLAMAFNAWIKARKELRAANRKLDTLENTASGPVINSTSGDF